MSKELLKRCRDILAGLSNWNDERVLLASQALVSDIDAALKPKPKPTQSTTATTLSQALIDAMGRATGRKLLTTASKSARGITKLLKGGATEQEIMAVITWLEKENTKREYPFVVLSGDALYQKWDKIRLAMGNDQIKSAPRKEYW